MHCEAIKAIKYIGNVETVDITVDHPRHIYYANGIANKNSHAVEYAYVSLSGMACKVYFPTQWYTSCLICAKDKPDPLEEIELIIQDAKLHNIKVLPPILSRKNIDFEIVKAKEIIFGLGHIKSIGENAILQMKKLSINTFEELVLHTRKLRRNVVEALIKSGACDEFKMPRMKMLRTINAIYGRPIPKHQQDEETEPMQFRPLTIKEHVVFDKYINQGVIFALNKVIEEKACMTPRVKVIESKIAFLSQEVKDSNRDKAIFEKLYLGISLSCSAADDFEKNKGVITCRQALDAKKWQKFSIHIVIDELTLKTTSEKSKTPGRQYAILKVSDNSAQINVMIWPEIYDKYKDQLGEGLVCSITAKCNHYNDRTQYAVEELQVIG